MLLEGDKYAPIYAPFLGFCGCAVSIIFSSVGAAYGTAKLSIGIAGVGLFKPEMIMKCLIPVVMSGILSVYGLVVSVIIASGLLSSHNYTLFNGIMHLTSGMCAGLTCLASGISIGIVGDEGMRNFLNQPKLFFGIVLILIFAEVLGLYGMIIALIVNNKGTG